MLEKSAKVVAAARAKGITVIHAPIVLARRPLVTRSRRWRRAPRRRCDVLVTHRYMLRADNVDDARATAALFTREEAGEPEQHLRDMQASWYELEVGSALARRVTTGTPSELRELAGPALKLFLSVEKHFSDFVEDQFDFHTYCAVWKSNFTTRSC